MNKQDFITQITSQAGTSKAQAERIFDDLINSISQALLNGDEVLLAGLGKLKVVDRASRVGVNVRTGERLIIPAKKTVKFVPAKVLKDSLNSTDTTENSEGG